MEFVPAVSVLIALLVIFLTVVYKVDTKQFVSMLSGRGFLALSTLLLFGFVLVLHMFEAQDWTADILKVIVGVVLGLSTSYAAEANGVDIASSTFGDFVEIAGRDINKIRNLVDRMEAEVAEIRDSVFNQYQTVQDVLPSNGPQRPLDVLVNTIYERRMEEAVPALQRVINHWRSAGWLFKHICSDYQGMDGLILVFERQAEEHAPRALFYHGSEMREMNIN